VSPVETRGSMVTRNEVMIVSGQFAAFVIIALIFNIWGEHDGVWRYMLLVAVLPAFALFFGLLKMPESPRWLSQRLLLESPVPVVAVKLREGQGDA